MECIVCGHPLEDLDPFCPGCREYVSIVVEDPLWDDYDEWIELWD